MAAASAWDAIAAQLGSFAAGYCSALTSLQGQHWSGPASAAMASAAAPYVAWVHTTVMQAEQAATQARAAAAAYEAAHAATVPPAAVAANRAQWLVLVATNFFGQNTPAIAANEAAYSEMWAQDAAAMYGYAGSSSTATELAPFRQAPQTTNAGGQAARNAAVARAASTSGAENSQTGLSQVLSVVPKQLQNLATASGTGPATSPPPGPMLPGGGDPGSLGAVGTVLEPAQLGVRAVLTVGKAAQFLTAVGAAVPKAAVPKAAPAAALTTEAHAPGPAGAPGAVLAGAGKAAPIGKLSVPQSWPTSTAATNPAGSAGSASQPAATGPRGVPFGEPTPSTSSTGQPPVSDLGPMQRSTESGADASPYRTRGRRFQMPRPAAAG